MTTLQAVVGGCFLLAVAAVFIGCHYADPHRERRQR